MSTIRNTEAIDKYRDRFVSKSIDEDNLPNQHEPHWKKNI